MFRLPSRKGPLPLLCCLLVLCRFFQLPSLSWSLSTSNTIKDSPSSSARAHYGPSRDIAAPSSSSPNSVLHHDQLLRAIQSGRVYQHEHFLNEAQVRHLLQEIQQLEREGQFVTKGLSNTAKQSQQFSDRQDRSICVVPWFVTSVLPTTTMSDNRSGNDYKKQDEDDKTIMDWDSTDAIPRKIWQMQRELSQILGRPTIADSRLDHECYYSQSKVGSFLPRHMDERHEELKGAQGWLLPSRRSLSWLVYLSEPEDWDIERNGGALRTFPQPFDALLGSTTSSNTIRNSSHDGNLQVGWLFPEDGKEGTVQGVYLDSWFKPTMLGAPVPASPREPHCILYIVDDKRQQKERLYLTRPWLTEALQGMPVPDFLKACVVHDSTAVDSDMLVFRTAQYARRFQLLEDRVAWNEGQDPTGSETHDIPPIRGSLVIFDSVQLPHEVREIKSGTRRALAGWFHERTQEFPADFYG